MLGANETATHSINRKRMLLGAIGVAAAGFGASSLTNLAATESVPRAPEVAVSVDAQPNQDQSAEVGNAAVQERNADGSEGAVQVRYGEDVSPAADVQIAGGADISITRTPETSPETVGNTLPTTTVPQ